MTLQLVFTDHYTRRAARFIKRHSEMEGVYSKALRLLEANPHNPSLRLHAVEGKLEGLHSVSINMIFIIIIAMIIFDKDIILINVGDHDAVYR